ncbi:DegT/DnrJ/EryC1/StrS family aminotransferase [Balneola vulgaris]|uniref:DegT/DnrJ/EryC1/StrS family aminotransferase n=1 Tax=Balneola vulgaris TaxID=287535 RepID=UPI000368DB4A|nr:DegT/DnrJ/EryC1/StrS family aminotransferase [Balneola vulgaris]
MKIPFVDLKSQYESIKPEMDNAINRIISNTAFIGGNEVSEFEENFSKKYGVKHCISVGNGTDSLYIIMKMLGIGNGDEVITPANSWISSSETISQAGANPVFVDIEPEYYTMDPDKLESLINENTKAIMPVHLYGQMCDMDHIMAIAKKHNLFVIEDCAQSHFSEFNNQRAGLIGIAGSFSFYPGKNLGAYGDAGAIITNDDELAEKCRMYARHGALVKHEHKMEGINSRLDGIQAAVLNVKLKHILKWTDDRINNASKYDLHLRDIEEIRIPKIRPNTKHSFHLYVIRAEKRDKLADFLNENGIQTSVHYPTILPLLPAYNHLGFSEKDFSNSFEAQNEILSLPLYPELQEEQIKYVAEKICDFFK